MIVALTVMDYFGIGVFGFALGVVWSFLRGN